MLLLAFFLIIPPVFGIITLNKEIQIETPSQQDVETLVQEFHLTQKPKEQLFLIYFDEDKDFYNFLDNQNVNLIFRGLKGVVIKSTHNNVNQLIGKYKYLSESNFHLIEGSDHKYVVHETPQNKYNLVDDQLSLSIQTLASAAKIGANKMWQQGYKGQGVKICIIDEGINASHSDFSFPNGTNRVVAREGFVNTTYGNSEDLNPREGSHGTSVAGTAGGGGILIPNNQGIANESLFLDADVDESPDTNSLDFTILGHIAAINWAIENGADIINRSYGSSNGEDTYWIYRLVPDYKALMATIRQGTKQGVVFVHSAGNEGGSGYTISPDNIIEEITVAATDPSMTHRADFSSTGPVWRTNAISPDVTAPGDDIAAPDVRGGYSVVQGTSFSAPHVAGASALLINAARMNNLEINPGSVKSILIATAEDIDESIFAQGTGQINVSAAFDYLLSAQRIGVHPIVGATNPRNLNDLNLPQILLGTEYLTHFTFTSSEMKNASISLTGNISSLISFEEQLWIDTLYQGMKLEKINLAGENLSEQYSHDIILRIQVPENTPLGFYYGDIIFKVNDTNILTKPISFNVNPSIMRVLLHTGDSASFRYNSLGDFRELVSGLSSEGIVINENNSIISDELLSDYDVVWLAAENRTYSVYNYNNYSDTITTLTRDQLFTEEERLAIVSFVENGGGVIMTPYTTTLGVEEIINSWGISSKLDADISGNPGTLIHANEIGKDFGHFDISGSYFSVTELALPLAYHNQRKNIVLASYDAPFGGRAIIASGSDFITNWGYQNELTDQPDFDIQNDMLVEDILTWLLSEDQLTGLFKQNGDVLSFSLHISNNFVPDNSGGLTGSVQRIGSVNQEDVTSEMPSTGTNGWYNFTYTISEGFFFFNFSWNDVFIAFEIINDETAPIIGISGVENNTVFKVPTDVIFWFDDAGSGINQYSAAMTINGSKANFNTPKKNSTGTGYYIEKTFYPDDMEKGIYVVELKISDLAENTASIIFVFRIGRTGTPEEPADNGTSGFEWSLVISLFILGQVFRKKWK